MTVAWVDLRAARDPDVRDAICEAALHARVDVVLDDDAAALEKLPPTVTRGHTGVSAAEWRAWSTPDDIHGVDLVVLPVENARDLERVTAFGDRYVPHIDVADQAGLDVACAAAARGGRTLVSFVDPTKIPLEIVIAAAAKTTGTLVCRVADGVEARTVRGVLERGSEGVLVTPGTPAELLDVLHAIGDETAALELTTLTVESIAHVGLGDRVCVDTCSHFEEDEGILVGSFAHGFILCCSETHPLPYMPTRPFRVNAGALHSYVLQGDNRTNYLSELRSGLPVLAADVHGHTRQVVVGRVKLERRPMLQINARANTGEQVCLTVQDDWHVRVLGPDGIVLNVTELGAGSLVLGYLARDRRHVGYPVDEFCIEK